MSKAAGQARETLREAVIQSARQRCLVLASLLLVLTIPFFMFLLVGHTAKTGLAPSLLHRFEQLVPTVLAGLLLVAVGELAVWRYLGRLATSRHRIPAVLPALHTIIPVAATILLLHRALSILGPESISTGATPWLFFPVIILSALYLSFWLCTFAGVVAAFGYLLLGEAAMAMIHAGFGSNLAELRGVYIYKTAILLGTGLLTGLIALALKRQFLAAVTHAAERDRAVRIFGQHVSSAVARRLLDRPLPGHGENRHVCVLFLDIRNFSAYAATHSASEVMAYLNKLFEPLIDIVNDHHGVVNKFLGDGFMAVFGAPADDSEPERNAARCAVKLLAATRRLTMEGQIVPTRLGIGLHAGESVTGSVGAESRKEYTVIGDTVNIAARIEQATKQCHAQLLVSETVRTELPAEEFTCEDLGPVELKGQPHPLRLYRLA